MTKIYVFDANESVNIRSEILTKIRGPYYRKNLINFMNSLDFPYVDLRINNSKLEYGYKNSEEKLVWFDENKEPNSVRILISYFDFLYRNQGSCNIAFIDLENYLHPVLFVELLERLSNTNKCIFLNERQIKIKNL